MPFHLQTAGHQINAFDHQVGNAVALDGVQQGHRMASICRSVTVSDQTVFVASCKYRKRRTSVSHKGGGRNPKAFAESADLANIELPLACKDFRNYALTANLVQIALLDAVLFYQEL